MLCVLQISNALKRDTRRIGQDHALHPYELTMLSNMLVGCGMMVFALHPYELTMLSNNNCGVGDSVRALHPYELTMLSNTGLLLR